MLSEERASSCRIPALSEAYSLQGELRPSMLARSGRQVDRSLYVVTCGLRGRAVAYFFVCTERSSPVF